MYDIYDNDFDKAFDEAVDAIEKKEHRLIYADKLKAHYAWWKGGTREMTMDEAKADFDVIVDLQPTVDPTKHGHWIWNKRLGEWYCSNCDRIMNPYTVEKSEGVYEMAQPFYCGWCGARMDGGENER